MCLWRTLDQLLNAKTGKRWNRLPVGIAKLLSDNNNLTKKHFKVMKKKFDLGVYSPPTLKKLIMELKIVFLLTLINVSSILAIPTYSQLTKVSLDLQNTRLEQVMDKIESQSEFYFIFNQKQIDVNRVVSIQADNKIITDILPELFKGTNISYTVLDRKILLTTDYLDNNLLAVGSGKIHQPQQVTVKGTVKDITSGEILAGVNVVVTGTTTGTITDGSGNFSLVVPNASASLQFSFIGYVTQNIALGGQTTLNIGMLAVVSQLNEVVVVGYGTQLKKDLTGAVTSIPSAKLLDRPAFNIAQAISGKVAGVKIIERNGAPGSPITIRVRGTNSINSSNNPLFVVDGVVGVANALQILNPNEIQSLDILKDASATAIYGARGANGVIIITTKRGIAGKTEVEYDGNVSIGIKQRKFYTCNAEQILYGITQGWINVTKYATSPAWNNCMDAAILPASVLSQASTQTYSEMPYLFAKTTQGGYPIPLLGKDGNYYAPRFDTNWENEIFSPSVSTNHQFNIRGGSDKAKFGIFLNYADEQGLLLSSFFNRYSAKLNGDIKVFDWLDVSSNLAVNKSANRTNDLSYISGGIVRTMTESFPFIPVKYPNDPTIYGTRAGQWGRGSDFPVGENDTNPVNTSKESEGLTNRTQITGDVTFNFKITKDLSLKSNISVDLMDYKYNYYAGRNVAFPNASANINTQNTWYWQNENYFNYQKVFGDHSVTGLLGISWSQYRYENLNTNNSIFFDDFYGWHNIGIGTAVRPAPSSSDGMNRLNSYFARFNYSYKGKYLATITGRIDGSSRFGENSKYGFFPSGSLAWRISEEDFAKSISQLSNLKLRASVGQTGNQEIGNYVTQTFVGSTNVVLGNALSPGLYQTTNGNPALAWEKNTQYDAGLDIGLFRDRITLMLDYYYKLTTGMLLDVPLPMSLTTGTVKENYGKVENKGFEITLTTHNIKSQDFNWYTDINWSSNKNKILKLGPTGADILRDYWVGGANTILREGYPIGEYFGLTRLGVYSTQQYSLAARYGKMAGDVSYKDVNGDGLISFVADGGPLGCGYPKWDMDITNTIEYRNFDLSVDIKGSYGAKKLNRTNHTGTERQIGTGNKNNIMDSWRPDHQDTETAELRPTFGGAYWQTFPDTHWVEDCSFIRGDGATLGYNIPKSLTDKLKLTRLRVYFSAKNFFVITKYTGYDPEGADSDTSADNITPGIDFYMYPRPSTYTFGVNIVF
jgi:TonB-dependent starch-binding outer membrane protein SusC